MTFFDAPAEHGVGGIDKTCVFKLHSNKRIYVAFPKIFHNILFHIYQQVVCPVLIRNESRQRVQHVLKGVGGDRVKK